MEDMDHFGTFDVGNGCIVFWDVGDEVKSDSDSDTTTTEGVITYEGTYEEYGNHRCVSNDEGDCEITSVQDLPSISLPLKDGYEEEDCRRGSIPPIVPFLESIEADDVCESDDVQEEGEEEHMDTGARPQAPAGEHAQPLTPPVTDEAQLKNFELTFRRDNREYGIRMLDLKRLEERLEVQTLDRIREFDPQFNEGCLSNNLIDAVMTTIPNLMINRADVAFIPTEPMIALTNYQPGDWYIGHIKKLAAAKIILGATLTKIKGHNHFVLLVAMRGRAESCIYYYDSDPPPSEDITEKQRILNLSKPFIALLHHMSVIQRGDLPTLSPPHALQKDKSSCGVWVCHYAEQIIIMLRNILRNAGESNWYEKMQAGLDDINSPLTVNHSAKDLRHHFYHNRLVQHCTVGASAEEKLKCCPQCMVEIVGSDQSIECTVCEQNHHKSCVNKTTEDFRCQEVDWKANWDR